MKIFKAMREYFGAEAKLRRSVARLKGSVEKREIEMRYWEKMERRAPSEELKSECRHRWSESYVRRELEKFEVSKLETLAKFEEAKGKALK